MKKRWPVNIIYQFIWRIILKYFYTLEVRFWYRVIAPIHLKLPIPRCFHWQGFDCGLFGPGYTYLFKIIPNSCYKIWFFIFIHEFAHHTHGPGCIDHMDRRPGIISLDLHSRMCAAGGGPTNEQGYIKFKAFHFSGYVDHLVQAGSDQSWKTNDIRSLITRGG